MSTMICPSLLSPLSIIEFFIPFKYIIYLCFSILTYIISSHPLFFKISIVNSLLNIYLKVILRRNKIYLKVKLICAKIYNEVFLEREKL